MKVTAEAIRTTVLEYLAQEEAWGDNPQLRVNPETGETTLAEEDEDQEGFDYWPLMDLVAMSPAEPGKWEPDPEAIDSVVAEYAD